MKLVLKMRKMLLCLCTFFCVFGSERNGENIWKKLIPLYEKQLQLSKNSKYAHDEETILYLIWKLKIS